MTMGLSEKLITGAFVCIVAILFWAIHLVLMGWIPFADTASAEAFKAFCGDNLRFAEYACTLLAFCYAAGAMIRDYLKANDRKLFFRIPQNWLIQAGLFFTIIADWFLVIMIPRNQAIAMSAFVLSQISYFVLIYLYQSECKDPGRIRRMHLWVRGIVCLGAVVGCIVVLGQNTDYVALVSLFYIANLFINIIFAATIFKINRSTRLLFFGLLFFICCDILIGLAAAEGVYLDFGQSAIIDALLHSGHDFAWMFYPISQTLIALSANNHFNKAA
ncbi:MAG: hypothetical protein J6Y65_01170 [Eggerthellaceae bacterium]|nr:hypothetical protein [Eggerthellaceae bacterium]